MRTFFLYLVTSHPDNRGLVVNRKQVLVYWSTHCIVVATIYLIFKHYQNHNLYTVTAVFFSSQLFELSQLNQTHELVGLQFDGIFFQIRKRNRKII